MIRLILAIFSLALVWVPASTSAVTLSESDFKKYVADCKEELDFNSLPSFSCVDDLFRSSSDRNVTQLNFGFSNDYVAHRSITNNVDAIYACRWVGAFGHNGKTVSGEMIVHNRKTGGTCFFELKKDTFSDRVWPQYDIKPVSPTHSKGPTFWDAGENCTECHTAGPYIASPGIVGPLAKYGLINDKHDTFNTRYHAAGRTSLSNVNTLNGHLDDVYQPSCAAGCHVMRDYPRVDSIIGNDIQDFGGTEQVVMPSIHHVIGEIEREDMMPPLSRLSEFRWINRDTAGGSGDHERMSDVKKDYPKLHCDNPKAIEARTVGSDKVYYGNDTVANLRYFNLEQGLLCKNEDQDGASCPDFQTRYKCGSSWTGWKSTDSPSGTADNESRSRFPNLCANPSAIQARFTVDILGLFTHTVKLNGSPDRLRKFDRNGLVCKNDDQDDGKCNNYIVRFDCD